MWQFSPIVSYVFALVCLVSMVGAFRFQQLHSKINNVRPTTPGCTLYKTPYNSINRKSLLVQHMSDAAAGSAAGSGRRGPKKTSKSDVIQVVGKVLEALPNGAFRVEIEPTKQVLVATISGKIRKNNVRIIPGDSVQLDISAYDLTKGRITFRNK